MTYLGENAHKIKELQENTRDSLRGKGDIVILYKKVYKETKIMR